MRTCQVGDVLLVASGQRSTLALLDEHAPCAAAGAVGLCLDSRHLKACKQEFLLQFVVEILPIIPEIQCSM